MRLARLRSERFTRPSATTYRPAGAPLQDLGYEQDLVGNVVALVERTPGCGVAANPEAGTVADPALRALVARGDALVRRFGYDPLYRLSSASGRACAGTPQGPLWTDAPHCGFGGGDHGTPTQGNAPLLTATYRERYTYDVAGNLTRWARAGGASDTVRRFALEPGTNRLREVTVGGTTTAYTTDANGNVTGETTSRHFEWDSGDRLRVFRTQAGAAEPSLHAQYLYDADGARVKKVVRKQGGGVAVSTYVAGIFERHRRSAGEESAPGTDYLHVMDDRQRLGLVRVGPPHPDDRGPAVQHHLGDHLGSSGMVVDDGGGFVNREEYAPYGETTFGSFGGKRYRFTGMERDEESGLAYHGARYYAPWLGRWRSCDPAGPTGGANLYAYAAGNPVLLADPGGTQPRAGLVDVDDVSEPPPGLTLPSADPRVELQTESGGSRGVPLSEIRSSPGYVDNWERFEAQPDPLTLRVSEITFFYAGGSALRVPVSTIDPGAGSRSVRYKASAGLVLPLGSSGQFALDAENTPAIVAAAGYVKRELGQRSATRLELAEATFQFALAVGSLAAAWSPLPSLRTPMLPGGSGQLPLTGVTEAEIDAAVNAKMSSRYLFRTPVDVTEAGHAVESLVPASRWGRPGLKPGDWLMGGPPNRSNWLRSFKWEPNPTNIRAPFRAGEGYFVPPRYVTWPRGPIGWIKGLFGQRKYIPGQ
jgi:RHS repeat-associated protein